MSRKRAMLEKGFVALLFILVLVVFSFAERDTRRVVEQYNSATVVKRKPQASPALLTAYKVLPRSAASSQN